MQEGNKFQIMRRCFLLGFILSLLGCGRNYKLAESDLSWNPYKGGEILVFNSSQGDTDTIFVEIVEKAITDDDPLALFPNHREVLNVIVRHTRPAPKDSKEQMEDSFLELYATRDKNTLIDFNLRAKNAWFYSESYYVKDLNLLNVKTMTIKGNIYKDIVIIEPQENLTIEDYDERDEFVTKIYWSKTKGYVRYDIKNGMFWELQ